MRAKRANALLALGLAIVLAGFAAGSARSARAFQIGLTDAIFQSPDPATRSLWLDRTVSARASFVLFGADWAGIAPANPSPGFDASNPASSGYSWAPLDATVRDATARGLQVVVTVNHAPGWAEGPARPSSSQAPSGTWKPDPAKLEQFAEAIATRYSGHFETATGRLPRVAYFQLWAEPNLSVYLNPQWSNRHPVAPLHYRRMLNAFYAGIKSVSRSDQVITGGTAPYGDAPGGARMQPALFWRTLLCLKGEQLRPTVCPDPAHFDIAAHNPIDEFRPTRGALNRDDISTPDLGRLKRILAKARSTGRIKPGGRKPLWATEFWWDSNPPDPGGVPASRQARWLEQALYLFWKQGAKTAIWFQIRDAPSEPGGYAATYQTGLFSLDGTPKPAYLAYRFPFVADRLNGRTVRVWGMAPSSGAVSIQRLSRDGWKTLGRFGAGSDRVFTGKLRLRGAAQLRAQLGLETSLRWPQR